MFKGQVSGFEGMDEVLASLPGLVGEAAQMHALRVAAEPVRATAAELCPRSIGKGHGYEGHGHLADNIVIFDADVRGGKTAVVVSYPHDFFYGHMVEWGTDPKPARISQERIAYTRISKKTGELKTGYTRRHRAIGGHPGVKKQPFLRPAWDAHKGEFLGLFGGAMWQALSNALPSGWALDKLRASRAGRSRAKG